VGDNEIGDDYNEGESLAISIAMCRCSGTTRGASPDRARPGLHWKPLRSTFFETTQNTNETQLLASNYGTFRALFVCENFIPQNGPSTQIIDAKSFV